MAKQDDQWRDAQVYVEEQLDKIQEELDRRFTTQLRETAALKEMYDRVLAERETARLSAATERERYVAVLREKLEGQIEGVRRELTIIHVAAQEAVVKAESADAHKFDSHNGLIEQMRDQAVKAEHTLGLLVGTLLPRETFDSVMGGWDTWRSNVDKLLSEGAGERRGKTVSQDTVKWALGFAVAVLTIVVWVALATRGFTR